MLAGVPAVCRVTVHEHAGGVRTAVDLRDACFGSSSLMRIAAMFVPHNIFKVTSITRAYPSPPTCAPDAFHGGGCVCTWCLKGAR